MLMNYVRVRSNARNFIVVCELWRFAWMSTNSSNRFPSALWRTTQGTQTHSWRRYYLREQCFPYTDIIFNRHSLPRRTCSAHAHYKPNRAMASRSAWFSYFVGDKIMYKMNFWQSDRIVLTSHQSGKRLRSSLKNTENRICDSRRKFRWNCQKAMTIGAALLNRNEEKTK